MFATAAIERVGIPRVNVTDGPNGARGQAYPGIAGAPSTCIPCGSALGATWDPELVERLGALLGKEAVDRGCRGLLAPTVNLHRSPLGRAQLRVLLRGSAVERPPRRGLRAGGAVGRGLRHRQALRRQRGRVRAQLHELRRRRPLPARAVPGAVRAGRARRWRPGDHDGLQPSQRALVDRAAALSPRHPARRVGLRGSGDDGLVRRGRQRHVPRCRSRSRDAGPGARTGYGDGGAGAGGHGARSRPGCRGPAPAGGLRPLRHPRRPDAAGRAEGPQPGGPGPDPPGGDGSDGAAAQRRPAAARRGVAAARGGAGGSRRHAPDPGRRLRPGSAARDREPGRRPRCGPGARRRGGLRPRV